VVLCYEIEFHEFHRGQEIQFLKIKKAAQMPRPSPVSAAFPTVGTARLRPPADLGDGPERELFLQLVLSLRPDHFQQSDAILLTAFCRAAIMERTASAALAKSGYVDDDGEPSGWLKILTQSQRSLTTLSRLLRLNTISRPSLAAKEQHLSYYEKMDLARHDEQS
jgi:phage terminase small subunit